MTRITHFLARTIRAIALLGVALYFVFSLLNEAGDEESAYYIEDPLADAVRVRPRRITPGGAVLVDLRKMIRKSDRRDVRLIVGDHELSPVASEGKTLFFQIPEDLKKGPLRAVVKKRQSEIANVALDVRAVHERRFIRQGLGGLSLLLFGIWLLSRSFGKLGLTLVHSSARWLARSHLRCLFVGVLAGMVVQTPRAAARFFDDLLSLQLVRTVGGLLLVTGAFVGAWLVGALLPLLSMSDGLLLVPAGGLALFVARNGRDRWIALAIIGMGLMLYGLHLLRTGLGELAVPLGLAQLIAGVNAATWGGIAVSYVVGVFVGMLLQGPGAVFAVVVGLVQSTGFLGHDAAMAVLAGAISGTSVVAVWSSGALGPRAVRSTAIVAGLLIIVSFVQIALTPLTKAVLELLPAQDLARWAPGHKVLFPGAHAPLVVHFTLSLVAAAGIVAVAGWIYWRRIGPEVQNRWIQRLASREIGLDLGRRFGMNLSAALRSSQSLIVRLEERIFATSSTSGQPMRQELDELEALITEFLPGQQPNAQTLLPELHSVGLVLSQLHTTLEQAISFADALRECRVSEVAAQQVHELVQAVRTSLQDLGDALASGGEIDLERAQQVEIAINRGEAGLRQALCSADAAGRASAPSLGLLSSFAGTLENVGNEVYRLAVVLDRAGLPAGLR
jgi:hypothetical protein